MSEEELENELARLMGGDKPAASSAPTVPLAALKETREKVRSAAEENEELKQQLAYMAGQLDAMKTSGTAPAALPSSPAAVVDPYDQHLQAVDTELVARNEKFKADKMALAKTYDDAELTYSELIRQQEQLEAGYYRDITPLVQQREDINRAKAAPNPEVVHERLVNDPWVAQRTEQIRAENPWIDRIPQTLFDTLTDQAAQVMQSRGIALDSSPDATVVLRQTIAEVGKKWGLDAFGTQPAAPSGAPATAMPTVEQRKDKLTLAANHPPSIGKTGMSGQPDDMSARLASDKVTATEIANSLSQAEIERLLGVS